jgi:hypothetical protein
VVAVAITRLAKHAGNISPFVRFVKNYFAFYSLKGFSEAAATNAGNPSDHRASAALWTCQNEGYTHNA